MYTDHFESLRDCCACGGGTEVDDTPSTEDSYGDACTWYGESTDGNSNTLACGCYDDSDFTAIDDCTECSGVTKDLSNCFTADPYDPRFTINDLAASIEINAEDLFKKNFKNKENIGDCTVTVIKSDGTEMEVPGLST